MLSVSAKEVEDRLRFDNPWWGGPGETPFTSLPRRGYLPSFYNLVTDLAVNRAVILLGPRRVGKTVMLHQAIERLLQYGVTPTRIMYLSLDTPVYTGFSLERLAGLMAELHGLEARDPRYIFFDEIQYLKDWERHLKSLVDS